ncbi:MAG TPA: hypothetical protein VL443_06295 [Cyclobacteriaceae bacterium]|jgi:hypothetical protein|nr:hypothetical protein [Cyclobacteriaceae bacterium]
MNFDDVKPQIVRALKKNAWIEEPWELIDGFVIRKFDQEWTIEPMFGGPNIPTIMVLGESGRIYYFALKAIIPLD